MCSSLNMAGYVLFCVAYMQGVYAKTKLCLLDVISCSRIIRALSLRSAFCLLCEKVSQAYLAALPFFINTFYLATWVQRLWSAYIYVCDSAQPGDCCSAGLHTFSKFWINSTKRGSTQLPSQVKGWGMGSFPLCGSLKWLMSHIDKCGALTNHFKLWVAGISHTSLPNLKWKLSAYSFTIFYLQC